MEIGFAAIVLWDFVEEENEDLVIDNLEEIYGGEPDKRGGAKFGGGSWSRRIFGNSNNRIEADTEFESVRSIVETEVHGLYDVTTIGVLSPNQIEEVVNRDNRAGRDNIRRELESKFEDLPSLVDYDDTGVCGVYYVEREGGEEIIEDGELDPGRASEILKGEAQNLGSFGFQMMGYQSLIRGNHFVTPTVAMDLYQGLCVVRREPHPESGPIEDLILDPSWYSEFSGLKKYYRVNYWGDSRWKRLHDFDERSDEARAELATLPEEVKDVSKVLETSNQIQALQTDFVDFRTRYEAEYQSHRDLFEDRADDAESRFGVPYDLAIPNPEDNRVSEEEPRSVITYFEDNTEHTFEQVDELKSRVSEKVQSIVDAIEGRTTLAATDENIALQRRVSKLTRILTGLTVVLVVLTLALILLEII